MCDFVFRKSANRSQLTNVAVEFSRGTGISKPRQEDGVRSYDERHLEQHRLDLQAAHSAAETAAAATTQ